MGRMKRNILDLPNSSKCVPSISAESLFVETFFLGPPTLRIVECECGDHEDTEPEAPPVSKSAGKMKRKAEERGISKDTPVSKSAGKMKRKAEEMGISKDSPVSKSAGKMKRMAKGRGKQRSASSFDGDGRALKK